ncbi:branched-chain amino acid ABC transporter permease [Actinomadura decatromicini]|uniref:Branched-chain amino acid ABC transporter permease n=1 Tax=Actinomadura decatromicini TaxID=2604572 RepID=A0A5D3FML0_9ACTN|nr:branched-chain amino acid ABC transporter permease [Actinomadura decatromicini]TYK49473.1 branched-chain amino acid ABC transporter permease [Actinomadura decatromicini]
MSRLIELLAIGVSLGSIYALIAVGFAVIFKGTRVVNFAQGSLLLLGAYVVAALSPHTGFWPALGLGLGAGALGGLGLYWLVGLVPHGEHMTLSILTIGADVLLATELARRIGSRVMPTGDPWADGVWRVGGLVVPHSRTAALLSALLVIGLLFVVFKRTTWGVSWRSAAADPEVATLMGIRLRRVRAASWLIGGALATLAGLFLVAFPNTGVEPHTGLLALRAVPAVIIGGLDSPEGAVAGGIAVGVTETLVAGYADELGFLGQGAGDVTPYLLMILILLWRPSGLFGSKEAVRV